MISHWAGNLGLRVSDALKFGTVCGPYDGRGSGEGCCERSMGVRQTSAQNVRRPKGVDSREKSQDQAGGNTGVLALGGEEEET